MIPWLVYTALAVLLLVTAALLSQGAGNARADREYRRLVLDELLKGQKSSAVLTEIVKALAERLDALERSGKLPVPATDRDEWAGRAGGAG